MIVERFYDEGLAHASYVIISNRKAAVIDPARDPQPYYDFVDQHNARIMAIIETHPHADFVSSHVEMSEKTGAAIYVSRKVDAGYPHRGFDEGDSMNLNGARLRPLHTPGHSPDSISILLLDENGKQQAVFTGDTLFIGDVGRPDLREEAGHLKAKREELARQMYHTTRDKLMKLDPHVMIHPAHGQGSLCGKAMSDKLESTLAEQLQENDALQPMSEDEFVDFLLEGQPFIPPYFSYDVALNKKGAPALEKSIKQVPRPNKGAVVGRDLTVVDTRPAGPFRAGHPVGAINIMNDDKFETWLGTLIRPGEKFYLVTSHQEEREEIIRKAAKIGYEPFIAGALIYDEAMERKKSPSFNLEDFKQNPSGFNILDVRNQSELDEEGKIFEQAQHIPLPDLRERVDEVKTGKPLVVHCSGGYRSAAAASILEKELGERVEVFDLSEAVKDFAS